MNIIKKIELNREQILEELYEWAETFDWQLDEDQIANMKALGLWEDDEPEENSLIARN